MEAHDQAVELDLLHHQRQVVCTWHVRNFGYELVLVKGELPASQSVCEKCRLLNHRCLKRPNSSTS